MSTATLTKPKATVSAAVPLLRRDMTSAELTEVRQRITDFVPRIEKELADLSHEYVTSPDPEGVVTKTLHLLAKAFLVPGSVGVVVGALEAQRLNERMDECVRHRESLAGIQSQLRDARAKRDATADDVELAGANAMVKALEAKESHLQRLIDGIESDTRQQGPRARASAELAQAEARLRRVRSLAEIKDPKQRPEHYDASEESALEGRIAALRLELENLPPDVERLDPLNVEQWPGEVQNRASNAREVWRGRVAKHLK